MPAISKTVLVTGASSGIGEATALRLVKAGWTVAATARRPETLRGLADAGCDTQALDMTEEGSMVAAVERITERHGAIGVLVNNAGHSQSGALETLPIDKVRAQFETNLFGLLRLTRLVVPGMRDQSWGRIVNISSMGGKLTFPGGGAYHASKHALEAVSDVLRFELGGFGIAVVIVEPGLVRSGFAEAAVATMDGEASGPYAELERAVARLTREAAVKGPFAWLAGSADDVARVVEKAINASRPRTRYRVTAAAHLLMTQRRLLGDRLWDAFLRQVYPRPRA